jgi:hypothetical protein
MLVAGEWYICDDGVARREYTQPKFKASQVIMGLILCPKHGATGIALLCPHIEEALAEQTKNVIGHEVRGWFLSHCDVSLCWICSACRAQLPDVKGDEWLEIPEDHWPELSPMCGQCFQDAVGERHMTIVSG